MNNGMLVKCGDIKSTDSISLLNTIQGRHVQIVPTVATLAPVLMKYLLQTNKTSTKSMNAKIIQQQF
jgi:hypothetical protein